MMKFRTLVPILMLAVAAAAPGRAAAQTDRVLPALGGALVGAAGGGYIAVSIIVLEARFGRYVHDINDILTWRSAPVVGGAVTGVGLGVYSPRRLEGAVVYGAGGFVAGGALGWAVGALVWDPPEGRWAGMAIGAGLGLMAGNLYGILNPLRSEDKRGPSDGIPVMIRVRAP